MAGRKNPELSNLDQLWTETIGGYEGVEGGWRRRRRNGGSLWRGRKGPLWFCRVLVVCLLQDCSHHHHRQNPSTATAVAVIITTAAIISVIIGGVGFVRVQDVKA